MPKVKHPLNREEKQRLLFILKELDSRGVPIPDEYSDVFQERDRKWPVDPNGYFIRRDGHLYVPSEAQEGFIKDTAPFSLYFGPQR